MLHLMKLKGCVPLLNILWGYLIVTFALGEKKCERNANRGEGVMLLQTFTHNSGEGSYVSANVHTTIC